MLTFSNHIVTRDLSIFHFRRIFINIETWLVQWILSSSCGKLLFLNLFSKWGKLGWDIERSPSFEIYIKG